MMNEDGQQQGGGKMEERARPTSVRVLKFRAWDRLDRRMLTADLGHQPHYTLSLSGRFFNLQNGSGGQEYKVSDFTGFFDLDGNEIYEGDILSHQGGVGEVEMCLITGQWRVGGIIPLYQVCGARITGTAYDGEPDSLP